MSSRSQSVENKPCGVRARKKLGTCSKSLSSSSGATLTVPESGISGMTSGNTNKISRSTSPLNFKVRMRNKKSANKLEKQCANCEEDEETNEVFDQKPKSSRKKSRDGNPFSVYFRNRNCSWQHSSGDKTPSLSPRSAQEFQYDGQLSPKPGSSPEGRGSLSGPRSPSSPGGSNHACRCRRCSLLPLEECEPKEVSMLYRFLRKTKVKQPQRKIDFNLGNFKYVVYGKVGFFKDKLKNEIKTQAPWILKYIILIMNK